MPPDAPLPIVVAVTGASGAPYAVRLLTALAAASRPTWLVVSAHGWRLLETECGIASLGALRDAVGELVAFIVARILDQLGVEHAVGRRWGDGEEAEA